MTDLERLRVLLPHWIDHNQEHMAEFIRWVKLSEKSDNIQVAAALKGAISAAEQVTEGLQQALEMAGGGLDISIDNPASHVHKHEHK